MCSSVYKQEQVVIILASNQHPTPILPATPFPNILLPFPVPILLQEPNPPAQKIPTVPQTPPVRHPPLIPNPSLPQRTSLLIIEHPNS